MPARSRNIRAARPDALHWLLTRPENTWFTHINMRGAQSVAEKYLVASKLLARVLLSKCQCRIFHSCPTPSTLFLQPSAILRHIQHPRFPRLSNPSPCWSLRLASLHTGRCESTYQSLAKRSVTFQQPQEKRSQLPSAETPKLLKNLFASKVLCVQHDVRVYVFRVSEEFTPPFNTVLQKYPAGCRAPYPPSKGASFQQHQRFQNIELDIAYDSEHCDIRV